MPLIFLYWPANWHQHGKVGARMQHPYDATQGNQFPKNEVIVLTGKKGEVTSPKVASQAGKLLSNPKSPAAVKTVAASALTQAANKGKK
jgi:hypothetical protein